MVTLDRSGTEPLWTQVLADLRRRIDVGEISEAFPTDQELTEQYGVSRHTVREAVRHLTAAGIIRRERGRGTIVERPTIEQATGAIYSLARSIQATGLSQHSRVVDLSVVEDQDISARLGSDPASGLVRLERVRFADDEPLAHDTAWLPATLAAPLLDVDFATTTLYDALGERCGVRPTGGVEWISTELPETAEADALQIAPGVSVFRIRRLSRAGDDPIEWRETVVRGDRYRFVAEWSPSGGYQARLSAASDPGGPVDRGTASR